MTAGRPLFENTPHFTKLILFVSIVFVCFIICMFFGFLIALPLFNLNFAELLKAISQSDTPGVASMMKYFQSVSQIGLFILPALIFAWLVSKKTGEYLQLKKGPKIASVAISCLIMIIAVPFINWLVEINANIQLPGFLAGMEKWMKDSEDAAAKMTEVFLNVSTLYGLVANLFVIAVLAAVGEELFFRGVLQKLFFDWTKNIHVAIFVSAFLFGAFHMQFYGIIPRMLMGALFGYLLYWSGSIWLPIMAHFTNNALAVILDFLDRKKQLNFDIDKIGTEDHAVLMVSVSFLLICLLTYLFYRIEKTKKTLQI